MILTIAHDKGGVGKTTLSWHMVFVLQQVLNKKVKVVDLDAKHTIFHLNNIRKAESKTGIEVVTPKSVNELISLCENYKEDILLIDVGGYDNDKTRTAIKRADKILTPLGDSATEIIGFATFGNILRKIGNPHVNIVFNRIHQRRKNFDAFKKDLSYYENITFLNTVIRVSTPAYQTPLKKGGSVVDTKKIQHIEDIKELCHELI